VSDYVILKILPPDLLFSLMPLMFVTYMLQYLDKITLGYTAVLGIQADTVSELTHCDDNH
jgi:hypothetical protein